VSDLAPSCNQAPEPRAVARYHLREGLRRQARAGSDEALSELVALACDGDELAHLAVVEVIRGPRLGVYG